MDMVHPKYVEDQDIFDKAMLVFCRYDFCIRLKKMVDLRKIM